MSILGLKRCSFVRTPHNRMAYPLDCGPGIIKANPYILASKSDQEKAVRPQSVHDYLLTLRERLGDKKRLFIKTLQSGLDLQSLPRQLSSYRWRMGMLEYMLEGHESGDPYIVIFRNRYLALEILLSAPPLFQIPLKDGLEKLIQKPGDPLKINLIIFLGDPNYRCRLSFIERIGLLEIAVDCNEEIFPPWDPQESYNTSVTASKKIINLAKGESIPDTPPGSDNAL